MMRCKERIEAELKDAAEYDELAEKHPDHEQIFRDIAHEERIHAELLKHLLERSPHKE